MSVMHNCHEKTPHGYKKISFLNFYFYLNLKKIFFTAAQEPWQFLFIYKVNKYIKDTDKWLHKSINNVINNCPKITQNQNH